MPPPDYVFAFVGLALCEIVLTYAAPRLVAPFARIPLGKTRSVPLPPRAVEALTLDASAAASYRAAPERHFDLTRLPGPSSVDCDAGVLTFISERGEVMARRRFDLSRKAKPIVFVRMRAEGDRIALDARYYPSQIAILVVVLVSSVVMSRSVVPAIAFGFVCLIPFFMNRTAARALVDAVEVEVASRVRRLGEEGHHVRVGDDPVASGQLAPALAAEGTAVGDARDRDHQAE